MSNMSFEGIPPRRIVLVLTIAILLAGCGGGSGGAGDQSQSGPNVPTNPEAAATPQFNGNTVAATLTQSNAPRYGLEVQHAIDIVATVSESIKGQLFPSDTNASVIYSSQAGNFVEGRLNSNGTAWLQGTFNKVQTLPSNNFISVDIGPDLNPIHGALTLSGKAQVVYLTSAYGNPLHSVVSYYGLEVSGNGFDFVLNGTVDEPLTYTGTEPDNYSGTITANLSIEDKLAKTSYLLSDFIILTNGQDIIDSSVTVSGTLTDAQYGAIKVSTGSVPLKYIYAVSNLGPFNSGYFKMEGEGLGAAYFGSLNYHFASVAFDPTGVGYPASAQRYSWTSNAPDTTPANWTTGPVAYASILSGPTLISPGVLDGRFSYSPAGDFLTFAWSIELSPPGSNPKFDNPASATPQFSVDQPGGYLLKLVVSNGHSTATDRIVLSVPGSTDIFETTKAVYKIGPATVLGQIGQRITLDSRVHNTSNIDLEYPAAAPDCGLVTPTGSSATLSYPDANSPTFTPDIDGYYVLNCGGISDQSTVVNVNEPLQFSPPVQFFMNPPGAYVAVDLNGDGKTDIATATYPDAVSVFIGQGNGRFTSQNFNIQNSSSIAAGDMNGDGLDDLAVGAVGNIEILTQQAGGVFKDTESVSLPCSYPVINGGQLTVAKLGSDSAGSLIYKGGCTDGTHIIRNNGTGGFTAQSVLPSSYAPVQAADITGDGIIDLIAVVPNGSISSSAQSNLAVFPGKSDGTFGTEVDYSLGSFVDPLSGLLASLQIIDINGDGKLDVAIGANRELETYLQQSGVLSASSTTYSFNFCSICDFPPLLNPMAADLNGDGLNDLLFSFELPVSDSNGTTTSAISFKLQDSSHGFSSQIDYPTATIFNLRGTTWQSWSVFDLNSDGIPDIIFDNGVVILGEPLGQ